MVTKEMSVKRKFTSWLLELSTQKEDKSLSTATAQCGTPDVADITGLLRSAGFRLSNVDLGQPVHAQSAVSGCKVVVTCPVSGLRVTLESDGDCRCPKSTGDHSVSSWCVSTPQSPSASQESLNKTEQAGCSVLPEVPGAVAEVMAWTVRCVMRLLEDFGPGPAARTGAGAASAKRQLRASLSAGSRLFEASDPDRLGAHLAHSLSLDEMEWQAASSLLSQPTLPASARQPEGAGLSAAASTSGSSGMPRSDSVEYIPEGEREILRNDDVFAPPPPRRQSSTLEEYDIFKKNLQYETQGALSPRTSLGSVDSANSVNSVGVASAKSAPPAIGCEATFTAGPSGVLGTTRNLPPQQSEQLLAQLQSVQCTMQQLMNTLQQGVPQAETGRRRKLSEAKPAAPKQFIKQKEPPLAVPKPTMFQRTPRPQSNRRGGLLVGPEASSLKLGATRKTSQPLALGAVGKTISKVRPKSSKISAPEVPKSKKSGKTTFESSSSQRDALTPVRRLSRPDSLPYMRPPSLYECKQTPTGKGASGQTLSGHGHSSVQSSPVGHKSSIPLPNAPRSGSLNDMRSLAMSESKQSTACKEMLQKCLSDRVTFSPGSSRPVGYVKNISIHLSEPNSLHIHSPTTSQSNRVQSRVVAPLPDIQKPN